MTPVKVVLRGRYEDETYLPGEVIWVDDIIDDVDVKVAVYLSDDKSTIIIRRHPDA